MKKVVCIICLLVLSGCYPINKTLQPRSIMTVLNEAGEPIRDAIVYLVSNAYPYRFEKTRMIVHTNNIGEASFPKIKEWRTEILMIHGAETYFWNWCVIKEGYSTYTTGHGSASEFEESPIIKLSLGESSSCPSKFN